MCHGEEGIKPLFDTFFEVDAELIEKQEKKEAEERANTLVELLEQETEEKAEMKHHADVLYSSRSDRKI